ncbi:LRR receptor-like serine threonine-protein kinase At4g08850-like [Seminavis robusta]|uniref:LRR receptor-like serine threonine-protein kinase At4g08850-like n=1 Tax=Seminavis robusta TaxID=568900 RepID=A0A9N8E6Q2_9STRA|nr:LRR receptor-like serine threonine-protein kinase At4g08850-like [Seminavis robusta]|eukprot:Sro733_g194530.1 LRR receptor-like serine threonine-protein kinase At4g08850-like (1114) ;mRNA; r:15463-18907
MTTRRRERMSALPWLLLVLLLLHPAPSGASRGSPGCTTHGIDTGDNACYGLTLHRCDRQDHRGCRETTLNYEYTDGEEESSSVHLQVKAQHKCKNGATKTDDSCEISVNDSRCQECSFDSEQGTVTLVACPDAEGLLPQNEQTIDITPKQDEEEEPEYFALEEPVDDDCLPSLTNTPCGPNVVCADDQECCNPSCGICVEPGGLCTMEVCDAGTGRGEGNQRPMDSELTDIPATGAPTSQGSEQTDIPATGAPTPEEVTAAPTLQDIPATAAPTAQQCLTRCVILWGELFEIPFTEGVHNSGQDLAGPIPTEIGLLTELTLLQLPRNGLTGSIISELGMLTKLVNLWLHGNDLDGSIPEELGLLTDLEVLWLQDNLLTGSVPESVCEIDSLDSPGALKLDCDNLECCDGDARSAAIPAAALIMETPTAAPTSQCRVPCVEIWGEIFEIPFIEGIHMSGQPHLAGPIPTEIGLLTELTLLHLPWNQLTGTIVTELAMLTKLHYLWLNNNELNGTIPEELGLLTNLEELWLHENLLTGPVPEALCELDGLDTAGALTLDCDSVECCAETRSAESFIPISIPDLGDVPMNKVCAGSSAEGAIFGDRCYAVDVELCVTTNPISTALATGACMVIEHNYTYYNNFDPDQAGEKRARGIGVPAPTPVNSGGDEEEDFFELYAEVYVKLDACLHSCEISIGGYVCDACDFGWDEGPTVTMINCSGVPADVFDGSFVSPQTIELGENLVHDFGQSFELAATEDMCNHPAIVANNPPTEAPSGTYSPTIWDGPERGAPVPAPTTETDKPTLEPTTLAPTNIFNMRCNDIFNDGTIQDGTCYSFDSTYCASESGGCSTISQAWLYYNQQVDDENNPVGPFTGYAYVYAYTDSCTDECYIDVDGFSCTCQAKGDSGIILVGCESALDGYFETPQTIPLKGAPFKLTPTDDMCSHPAVIAQTDGSSNRQGGAKKTTNGAIVRRFPASLTFHFEAATGSDLADMAKTLLIGDSMKFMRDSMRNEDRFKHTLLDATMDQITVLYDGATSPDEWTVSFDTLISLEPGSKATQRDCIMALADADWDDLLSKYVHKREEHTLLRVRSNGGTAELDGIRKVKFRAVGSGPY